MDMAYVHTAINHFPIILAMLGAAAAIASLVWRRRAVWLYAVATLTLAGLSVYPVRWTGHQAEHSMEDMWYVTRDAIHDHEEAGDRAMWVLLAVGLVSAYAWWRAARYRELSHSRRDEYAPTWLRAVVVLGGLAAAGMVSYAAKLSDPILHYSPRLQHPPAPGIPATVRNPGADTLPLPAVAP